MADCRFACAAKGRVDLPGLSQRRTTVGLNADRFPLSHCRASSFALLQINRLIVSVLVELGSPYFVHGLMLGPPETDRRAETDIQVSKIFESVDELFCVELAPRALQSGDQNIRHHISLKRDIVGHLAGEIFCKR